MKTLLCATVVSTAAMLAWASLGSAGGAGQASEPFGQRAAVNGPGEQFDPAAVEVKPGHPHPPQSLLGQRLGQYVTIEGVPVPQHLKAEAGTLQVDTVNGKKLDAPVPIVVREQRLAAREIGQPERTNFKPDERVTIRGYESGSMIGTPPAVFDAAAELGIEVNPSQAVYQWRPHFVMLVSANAAAKP